MKSTTRGRKLQHNPSDTNNNFKNCVRIEGKNLESNILKLAEMNKNRNK